MSEKKMGRPRKELDWDQFHKLCYMQCTQLEIAGFFDMTDDTLNARVKEQFGETFSEYYKKASQGGKVSLRRWQWKSAEGGNTTMLIWLGKQHLDQKDKHEHSTDEAKPIILKYSLDDKPIEIVENSVEVNEKLDEH